MEKKAILTGAGVIHPLCKEVSKDKTLIICNEKQYACLTSTEDWRKDVSGGEVPRVLKYEDDIEKSMEHEEFLIVVQIFLEDEEGNPDGSVMGNCRLYYDATKKKYYVVAGAHFDCPEFWIHMYVSSDKFFLPGYHDMTANSKFMKAAEQAGFPVEEGQHALYALEEITKMPDIMAKMREIHPNAPFSFDEPIEIDSLDDFIAEAIEWLETIDQKMDTVSDTLSDDQYGAKMLDYITNGCPRYKI